MFNSRKTATEEVRRLSLPQGELDYTLIFSGRRSLGLQIYPDGRVVARAPFGIKREDVEHFIRERSGWIHRHRERFAMESESTEKGDVFHRLHYFQGKTYRLRWQSCRIERVCMEGEELRVSCLSAEDISKLLWRWYRQQAGVFFMREARPLIEKFEQKHGVSPSSLHWQWMKTRWGSCSSRGRINLNLKLIMTPPECLRYVLLHELCHLIHFNHSKAFYRLMDENMPDWHSVKIKLNRLSKRFAGEPEDVL